MLADRVAVIVDGRVVACDTPARLGDRHLAPTRVTFELPESETADVVPLMADAILQRDADRVTISTHDPEAQLRALLGWARRHHRALPGLAVNPPSLEDVYLELVGTPVTEPA